VLRTGGGVVISRPVLAFHISTIARNGRDGRAHCRHRGKRCFLTVLYCAEPLDGLSSSLGYLLLPNHAEGFDGSRILAGEPLIQARSSVRERVVRFSAIRKITTKVLLGSHERRCEGGNEVSRGMGAAKGGGPL